MQLADKDLISIQETRTLLKNAKKAQVALAQLSQGQIDTICEAIKDAAMANLERFAKMANEETGFGVAEDKVIKNYFASQVVYDSIKEMKTVGIVSTDETKKIFEVAVPMGVIAGLIPSTNPTSTVIYKALIAIKAGNAIVFSPHPSAQHCIIETVRVLKEAAL
ncbi:MAG: aldehyde dehydrogenase family protein, partial [Acetobacterium sp.]|nr:aldehyde dehydrogenase family protein [Acetobacterium sp.]